MTLDEIIDTLVKVLSSGNRGDIKLALHAFAAAISAKASEVQGEKPECSEVVHGTHCCVSEREKCPDESHCFCECHSRPPEPKESDCPCNKYPEADLRHCTCEPTPELPKEVQEKIIELYDFKCQRWDGYFKRDMEDFAHLCLSMRAK